MLLKLELLFTQEHGFKNVVLQNILSAHEDVGKVHIQCSVEYSSIIHLTEAKFVVCF